MAKILNVVIIGGSVCGLMHGIVLRRLGHNVRILERTPGSPESRGAGISARERATEFIDKFDVTKKPYHIPSEHIVFLDAEGRPTRTWNVPMKMTSWKSLYHRLRANFDGLLSDYCPELSAETLESIAIEGKGSYDAGKTVTNVEYKDEIVTVEFEEATGGHGTLHADLVIAADGSRSTVREILEPDLKPEYAGYIAWRGTVPEKEVSEASLKVFGEQITFRPMKGSHILAYLIPGENGSLKPGERFMNWVWYCNYPEGSAELDAIMTDTNGKKHHNTIPIGLIRQDLWAAQKERATQTLPPLMADLVLQTEQPFIQTINDIRSPRASFFDGKLLLVGDALAGFRPHAPSSTEQAALDALLLERVMRGEMTLSDWESHVLQYSNTASLHCKCYGMYWQDGVTGSFLMTLLQFGIAKVLDWFRGNL